MPLKISAFVLDGEILDEDGHGPSALRVNVPCPYETKMRLCPTSLLEVIVCVDMGRFLFLFD
jgi:hypothetical protein